MSEVALDWKDISDELERTYTFPGGHELTIRNPSKLSVKSPLFGEVGGGSHRIADMDGNGHYISYGWLGISWKVKPGSPAVAF